MILRYEYTWQGDGAQQELPLRGFLDVTVFDHT